MGPATVLAFARAIAPLARPLPLLPLHPDEKRPFMPWKHLHTRAQYEHEVESALRARAGGVRVTAWGGALGYDPALVVVDVDDLQALAQQAPTIARRYLREQVTPVHVATRRGRHLYYRAPDGERVRCVTQKIPGLDIKAHGGQVVLPGSTRGDFCYQLRVDGAPADARAFRPAELFERLPVFPLDDHLADLEARGLGPREAADEGRELDGDDEALTRRALAYLRACGPAVEHHGGHAHTMRVLRKLGDLGFPEHIAEAAAAEWNADNCPPWSAGELERKVCDAYSMREDPIGRDNAEPSVVVDL